MKGRLRHLRAIERGAYPPAFRQLQDCRTWADLRAYCEGEPRVWTWPGGYLLATDVEIVDLASTIPVSLAQLRRLAGELAAHFGSRDVTLDARERTSWRLIRYAARRGILEIRSAEPWEWDGERFFETTIRFRV